MSRSFNRARRPLPHAQYGVDLARVPDTYIDPFVAYRAWNWNSEGITSLNGALWTPKIAFEATCPRADDMRSMQAASGSEAAKKFWEKQAHHVPDPDRTCGMYAGINMQHLIDMSYIQRGIHGEVNLWGRLYRHTLGWRAQYAYPKFFVVPMNMIPLNMALAQERLKALVEFDVDIYLQPGIEAKVGGERFPLWIREYGYSQQALSVLIEKRKKWYEAHPKTHTLAVGDRIAVFSDVNGGGIGIAKEISNGDMHYTMFNPNVIYRKPVKEVLWNEKNWRWETTGLGSGHRMDAKPHQKCSPLGGDRCRS